MSQQILLEFCENIAQKYNIELNSVLECWNPNVVEIGIKGIKGIKVVKEVKETKKKSMMSSNIEPKLNAYGNYEHKQSGFVFDKDTKKVIGKQVGETVMKLNESDLEMCKRMSVSYDVNAVAPPETRYKEENEKEVDNVELEEYDELENIEEYIE